MYTYFSLYTLDESLEQSWFTAGYLTGGLSKQSNSDLDELQVMRLVLKDTKLYHSKLVNDIGQIDIF